MAAGKEKHRRDKRGNKKTELKAAQIELVKLQREVIATGQKILVIFEGRDAAGKAS